jgi:acyl CoA:acetate/3-ketoacid CoA transferase alpha subunit
MLRALLKIVDWRLDTLLGALANRKDVKNLTGVSNNAGAGDSGLGTAHASHPVLFLLSMYIHDAREASER